MPKTTQKTLKLDRTAAPLSPVWSKIQEEDGAAVVPKRSSKKPAKTIQYGQFRPGMAVALRRNISDWSTGEVSTVWISGYEVHDPSAPNASALKPRKSQIGWVPIVRAGEHESHACFYQPDRLEPLQPGKQYRSFSEIYPQRRVDDRLDGIKLSGIVELNDRENEALIRESIVRETL